MIQTVKCSPPVDIKFYQGFYDALCTLNLFFASENSLFGSRRHVTCEMFISKAFRRPCAKKLYLRLYLTQIVHSNSKMLFLKPYNCLSKFLGALLKFSNFLLQGKILCFAHVGMSLARCLFPKRSEDLVQKIISPVIFDTNCSFRQ